jgi:KipI family sensor histidine kinase inhibitor
VVKATAVEVRPAGDAALLIDLGDEAMPTVTPAGYAAGVTAALLPGVLDVVPGACTVLVSFEPGSWRSSDLARQLRAIQPAAARPGPATAVTEIDVCYDGADLADVAALTRLTVPEVVRRHSAASYRVGWLGFSPGFGYLTGLDPLLAGVPRLDTPRVSVPAGSVAIAGGFAAVYPAASPGGWRLLGRTGAVLWDTGRQPPALLAPGTQVRFRPVTELPEQHRQSGAGVRGAAPPDPPDQHRHGPVEVLQPGPLSTIQDQGRPGFAHLGVPHSGAADPGSLRLANELAGNEPGDAALEVTLGRLSLRFGTGAVAALTGAPAPIRVVTADGDTWQPEPGTAFAVPAGGTVRLGVPAAGLRSYLAVRGGIDAVPVLHSRSTDVRSALGPRPLRAGDRLRIGPGRSPQEASQDASPGAAAHPSAAPAPVSGGGSVVLRAIPGPRDDWFSAAALETLASASYTVSPASDRTGLRLAGPGLGRARAGELPSEGMATGSVQVATGGQPILLLADHPTTGGYPVIAVVRAADIGLAAQLRPGQKVSFALGS